MPVKPLNRNALSFCALTLLVVAMWWLDFAGFWYFDDATYSSYAMALAKGGFNPSQDHFGHRLGIIVPQAIIYALLGWGPRVVVLLPLLCTLGTMALVFRLGGGLAAMLTVTSIYVMLFSHALFPDPVVMLASTLAFYAMVKGRQVKQSSRLTWLWPLLFALGVFWAFTSKLTSAWLWPFFAGLAVLDVCNRRHSGFWARCGLGLVLLFGAYFLAYQWLFGHWAHRFITVMEGGHYLGPQAYWHHGWNALWPRLTTQPFVFLATTHIGLLLLLAMPVMLKLRKPKHNQEPWYQHLPTLATLAGIVAWLCFWFGSTSLQYYSPIALFGRHALLIMPLLAIGAAHTVRHYLQERRATLFVLVGLVGLVGLVLFNGGGFSAIVFYGLWGLWWLAVSLVPKLKKYSLAILQAVLLFVPVFHIAKAQGLIPSSNEFTHTQYKHLSTALREQVSLLPSGAVVVTDEMTAHGHALVAGYHALEHVKFVPLQQVDEVFSSESPIYFLQVPWHTQYLGLPSNPKEYLPKSINCPQWSEASSTTIQLIPCHSMR